MSQIRLLIRLGPLTPAGNVLLMAKKGFVRSSL